MDVLAEVAERYNWICHAYCPMTNHDHLVAETVEGKSKAQIAGDRLSVPQAQRRPPPASLAQIAEQSIGRNAAIVAAYATGAYTYREIADYFGVHLVAVGRSAASQ